ncbi:MAG: [LysW]-aminoadipate kinase [Planctomycetes bacterium]|nr:[LysW]-aminoadipate kinase [Planctomycetota bacterium]
MTIVKLGGSVGRNPDSFCADAARLIHSGTRMIIVHGGSEHTNELSTALGRTPQFITSPSGHTSRRTDRATLEIMQMACRGLFNQQIVERLGRLGIRAVGLSGMDGSIWRGERKEAIRAVVDGRVTVVRDDFTGTVTEVNAVFLRQLLDAGLTPVLSPPAVSFGGDPINVDADRAAAVTAAALGARDLLLLSNVPGLLARFPDESSLISRLSRSQLQTAQAAAQGRMKKKVLGAVEALDAGVQRVIIADARPNSPITQALQGAGTLIE